MFRACRAMAEEDPAVLRFTENFRRTLFSGECGPRMYRTLLLLRPRRGRVCRTARHKRSQLTMHYRVTTVQYSGSEIEGFVLHLWLRLPVEVESAQNLKCIQKPRFQLSGSFSLLLSPEELLHANVAPASCRPWLSSWRPAWNLGSDCRSILRQLVQSRGSGAWLFGVRFLRESFSDGSQCLTGSLVVEAVSARPRRSRRPRLPGPNHRLQRAKEVD